MLTYTEGKIMSNTQKNEREISKLLPQELVEFCVWFEKFDLVKFY